MAEKKVVEGANPQLELAPVPVDQPMTSSAAPQVELTEEQIAAEKAEVAKLTAGLGVNPQLYTAEALAANATKAKGKAKVAPPVDTPAVKVHVARPKPVKSSSPLAPVLSPSEVMAALQKIADDAEQAKQTLIAQNEKAKLAAKLATVDDTTPVDVQDVAARVQDKLESAQVQARIDAQKQEQSDLAKKLVPVRKDLVKEIGELEEAMVEREPLVPVLDWDYVEMERRKLLLSAQAGRYRWCQDILKTAPTFMDQMQRALVDLDQLPESGLRGQNLQHAWKLISDTIQWSLGCAYNVKRAVKDLTRLLAELDATTLKPSVPVESSGHAALSQMVPAESASPIQNKAVVSEGWAAITPGV